MYPLSNISAALMVGILLGLATVVASAELAPDPALRICGEGADYEVRRLDGEQRDALCHTYRGKAMLVVNTASRCAYTEQYEELEKLYADYRERGLVVLGFPSNDFGNQEPGSEQSIKAFCRLTYGVRFPMYAKTRVKGAAADPLYRQLARASGQAPAWNFHKYLIDREGRLAGSFGSHISPDDSRLIEAIEGVL